MGEAISRKFVTFIVGAGASAEFGLPTGAQLVELIQRACSFQFDDFGRLKQGDYAISGAIRIIAKEDNIGIEQIYHAADKVRVNMALAPSIDNFLDSHQAKPGWSKLGKIAIAKSILEEEKKSRLFKTRRQHDLDFDFTQLSDNWLVELFRILVTHRDKKAFLDALSKCRFITFNYDRVIELFFRNAICSYFDTTPTEAKELCNEHLNVFHVYGSIGELEDHWHSTLDTDITPQQLLNSASRIKTFSEGVLDHERMSEAKSWLKTSTTVISLGFGFLPLNLKALAPENGQSYGPTRFLGTRKGLSDDNARITRSIIQANWYNKYIQDIELHNQTCSQLIWDHSLHLVDCLN